MASEAEDWLWWGGASSAQLAVAISFVRRGLVGSSTLMPLKAFAVASLFVGAGATGAVATLHAHGVRDLDDWKQVGAGFRSRLGAPPRAGAPKEREPLVGTPAHPSTDV